MPKFVRVKYNEGYTNPEGNNLWLNLDNIVAVDEVTNIVWCVPDFTYIIDEEDMPKLIEALKGGDSDA